MNLVLILSINFVVFFVACHQQNHERQGKSGQSTDPEPEVQLPKESPPSPPTKTDRKSVDVKDNSEDSSNPWEDWYRNWGRNGNVAGAGDPVGEATACVKGNKQECKVEAEIIRLVNIEREKSGLEKVEHNFEVSFVSRDWSEQQFSRRLSHAGFPQERQQTFREEFKRNPPTMAAENVAQSYLFTQDTKALARSLMTMWMSSSGHRGNILGRHRALGIGVSIKDSSVIATQIFVY